MFQATITNDCLHLKLRGVTFSSGTSAATFASSAAKFKLPWPLLNTLFFSGQADIGTQLKQACYRKINSTVSSLDLHVENVNMPVLVCILFACIQTLSFCQHGAM